MEIRPFIIHVNLGGVLKIFPAIFAGQVGAHFRAPPQVKPIVDICDLKEKLEDNKSYP